MKQILKDILVSMKYLALIILLLIGIKKINDIKQESNGQLTTLQVNNPTKDTILVYLTLNNNGDTWVNDVNGIFGIKSTNKNQGAFYLYPNTTKSYKSNKPFGGNISFNAPPLNCPYPAPTLYEFTLNNNGTTNDAQETIDISCVYGVTTIGRFTMKGGGAWNSGQNDTIRFFQNDSLYKNTGKAGVYPYGCPTCIGRAGMLNCSNETKYEKVNTKNICNVQRDSKGSGGIIQIKYLSTIR